MTETKNPRENPQEERIHGTIKNEILRECKFHNIDEAEEAVNRAVDFYNNERPHMGVGMRTPAQASKSAEERKLKWRSYREQAIKRKLVMNHTKIVYLWISVQVHPEDFLQSQPVVAIK